MKTLMIGAMATTMLFGLPAKAQTSDAFSSFTGTNGAGGFSYGSTDGTTLTPFTTSGSCVFGSTSTCLHSATDNLPQASIGGSYSTVVIPTNALVLHPGDSSALSVYGAYTATAGHAYGYTIGLQSVGTDTTDGIGYTPFTSIGGVVTLGQRGLLPTYGSSTTLTGTQVLTAGQSFGVIIDRNGRYYGDSTGLSFSIGAVPEPATWAMMLLGFGMIGAGLRYRRMRTAVRFV